MLFRSTGFVTVFSPIASDLTVTIIQGDSYNNADGRAITWTGSSASWPSLTGATLVWTARYETGETAKTATVTGTYSARLELASAESAALPAGSWTYDLRATLSSGRVVTLAVAPLIIKQLEQ